MFRANIKGANMYEDSPIECIASVHLGSRRIHHQINYDDINLNPE